MKLANPPKCRGCGVDLAILPTEDGLAVYIDASKHSESNCLASRLNTALGLLGSIRNDAADLLLDGKPDARLNRILSCATHFNENGASILDSCRQLIEKWRTQAQDSDDEFAAVCGCADMLDAALQGLVVEKQCSHPNMIKAGQRNNTNDWCPDCGWFPSV